MRQISVKFLNAVVSSGGVRLPDSASGGARLPDSASGGARLPDPVSLSCQGAVPSGSGRWANDRVWLYDFSEALPPGTRCVLTLKAEWKAASTLPSGAREYSFSTGGPAVTSVEPSEGSQITEDPTFALRLNGAAVESTVLLNAWCEVGGTAERIGVRVVAGNERVQWLKARGLDPKKHKAAVERILLLGCKRPLPFGAAARLVWGKGIRTAADPKVITTTEQRFRYIVRPAFTASLTSRRDAASSVDGPTSTFRIALSKPARRAV